MTFAVKLSHCSFKYPSSPRPVFEGLSLEIPEGESWGILGPNGSGKTSLIRLILGLIPPLKGQCYLYGNIPQRKNLSEVGVLVENPGVYKKLNPLQYLQYFAKIYRIENITSRLENLAQKLNLDLRSQTMGKMSLGQKQKVQLIRCLLHRPKLLILDEPFSHLDPESQKLLMDLIRQYLSEEKASLLLATHQLNLAESLISHVAFLHRGQIPFSGSLETLKAKSNLEQKLRVKLSSALLPDMARLEKQFSLGKTEEVSSISQNEKIYVFRGAQLKSQTPRIIKQLVEEGCHLYEAKTLVPDLYSLYQSQLHGEKF